MDFKVAGGFRLLLIFVLGTVAPAGAQLAPAGAQNTINAEPAHDQPGKLDAAYAALQLVPFAMKEGDPDILIGLARTLQLLEAQRVSAPEVTRHDLLATKPMAGSGADPKEPKADLERDIVGELLRAARLNAQRIAQRNQRETVLKRINAFRQTTARERSNGPLKFSIRIEPESYRTYDTEFRGGGELAEIVIAGDGDTDVDLEIYDENGNLICEGIEERDREYCEWRPVWTGQFTIRLLNYGPVHNDVVVVTN